MVVMLKMFWTYLLLLFSNIDVISSTAPSTLRLVNVVYRHGSRAPAVIFPTDSHQADEWPMGMGWLTEKGMRDQFRLGQWLRQRYDGFISRKYMHTEIEIRSSDVDRCLMSADCNLAGLYYPPNGPVVNNTNITLLPIPVHAKPISEDNMLVMRKSCPILDKMITKSGQEYWASDEVKGDEAFYKFVGEKTGFNDKVKDFVVYVADTVFCEKEHGMKPDDWLYNTSFGDFANDTIYDKLQRIEGNLFYIYFKDKQARLSGGVLLGEFVKNMWNMAKNSTYYANTTKMYMYSGHDSTIAAILSAMGVFNNLHPPPAATVITELHQRNGEYYVNTIYKNDTNGDTYINITLPGCNFNCPLDKFLNLTKHNVPVDWDKECALPLALPHAESTGKAGRYQAEWLFSVVTVLCFPLLI